MNDIHPIVERIYDEAMKQKYTRQSFSLACGFGPNTFYRYLEGSKPSLEHTEIMLNQLGIVCLLGGNT